MHRCFQRVLSSNVNEVIRAVLNSLFFLFLQIDFARAKSTKSTKKQKEATKQKHKTL